ncbi:MAG TPA: hypothetical protein VLC98_06790, partial [Phnomibacter sp.]|nr:hypothetical protein [Phnomibacter sp.]
NMPQQEVEFNINIQELKTWIKLHVLPTYRKNGTYVLSSKHTPAQLFGGLMIFNKHFPDSMSNRSIFNELIKQKKDAELHLHLGEMQLLFNLLLALNSTSINNSEQGKHGVVERLYKLLDFYSN